jgi:hypothetical protein
VFTEDQDLHALIMFGVDTPTNRFAFEVEEGVRRIPTRLGDAAAKRSEAVEAYLPTSALLTHRPLRSSVFNRRRRPRSSPL